MPQILKIIKKFATNVCNNLVNIFYHQLLDCSVFNVRINVHSVS